MDIYGYEGYEVYREDPVRIIITKDNQILFCGFDVAKLLGYKSPNLAVQDNCKNRIVIPYYRTSDSRMSRIAFIPETDVLKLVKNRVSNADEFLIDILNGKTPKVTLGKSSKKLAIIDLECKNSIVENNGKYYEITVKAH